MSVSPCISRILNVSNPQKKETAGISCEQDKKRNYRLNFFTRYKLKIELKNNKTEYSLHVRLTKKNKYKQHLVMALSFTGLSFDCTLHATTLYYNYYVYGWSEREATQTAYLCICECECMCVCVCLKGWGGYKMNKRGIQKNARTLVSYIIYNCMAYIHNHLYMLENKD